MTSLSDAPIRWLNFVRLVGDAFDRSDDADTIARLLADGEFDDALNQAVEGETEFLIALERVAVEANDFIDPDDAMEYAEELRRID